MGLVYPSSELHLLVRKLQKYIPSPYGLRSPQQLILRLPILLASVLVSQILISGYFPLRDLSNNTIQHLPKDVFSPMKYLLFL